MPTVPYIPLMKTGIAALALVMAVTGCGTASENVAGPSTTPESAPSESPAESEAPSPSTKEDVGPRAMDCVPGTWTTDMPSFVSTFQTPGDPTYVSGEYVFTFDTNAGFEATGDDVTFRLTNEDGFVEVHNSWTEDGLWAAANENVTFDEAMVVIGFPGDLSANEYAFLLEKEETELVALVGGTYTNVESYGLVNGSMRTPPLSDEGAAITAVGHVDCPAGEMSLIVGGAGWKGEFSLVKQGD